MNKVIYFDEGSATDFLQIYYGGHITSVNEETGAIHLGTSVKTDAELGAGIKFLTVVKAAFSLKASAEASQATDSLVRKTISNTILSDFFLLSKQTEAVNEIAGFINFSVEPIQDSFSFIKMYTPFMKIFKEDSSLVESLKDLNFLELDEILQGAKGYYELLAKKGDESVILRFNINAFRNNYSLTDLTKMDLSYFGIKVGESRVSDFYIQNEFTSKTKEESTRLTVEEVLGDSKVISEDNILLIYDVILAGVIGDK